jgi:hypothetical protein
MGEWITVKIRDSIAEKIDLFVGVENEQGAIDFDSRAAVVEAAIVDFLKSHKVPVMVEGKA